MYDYKATCQHITVKVKRTPDEWYFYAECADCGLTGPKTMADGGVALTLFDRRSHDRATHPLPPTKFGAQQQLPHPTPRGQHAASATCNLQAAKQFPEGPSQGEVTMDQHILVGKNVTAVYMNGDQELLRFHIRDGLPITARIRPACCTEGQIWAIDNPVRLLGIVQNVEDPGEGYHRTTLRNQDIQYYYCDITTDLGVCAIEFLATMDHDSQCGFSAKLHWPDAEDIADEEKERQDYPEEDVLEEWRLIAPPPPPKEDGSRRWQEV